MTSAPTTRGSLAKGWLRGSAALCLATVGWFASASDVLAYPRPGATERVSVTSDGDQVQKEEEPSPGSNPSCGSYCKNSFSAGGRYLAFESEASDLVEGDANRSVDIFVRDLERNTTERVSISSAGEEGIGTCLTGTGSYSPSLSANGRYVAFSSCAQNLVVGDVNNAEDIFVHDRKTGRTSLVSAAADGAPALCVDRCNEVSTQAISADGRYVTFQSDARNLVENDTNGFTDAFVKDLHTGTVELVSVASDGTQGDFNVTNPPRISADGRHVAFRSTSDNLHEDDTNIPDYGDVFAHDRKKHETELINVTADGRMEQTNLVRDFNGNGGTGGEVAISGDGRYVTFVSRWGGFIPNDTNDTFDVFVKDRKTGRLERVSVLSDGREGSAYSEDNMSITPDGRFIAFWTEARLVPDDKEGGTCKGFPPLNPDSCAGNTDNDVYVYDRHTGAIDLVSRDFEGGDDQCTEGAHCPRWSTGWPALDASGRLVAFYSYGDRHVRGDTNELPDTFVRERGLPLGTERFGSSPSKQSPDDDERICVTAEVCIPPNHVLSRGDLRHDVSSRIASAGADIIGARIAYRPQLGDLYLRIDVSEMPAVHGTSTAGNPLILYGFRLETRDAVYEIRAAPTAAGSELQPAFGLFHCDGAICSEVTRLKGGYGTTGENVVAAVPLDYLGLQEAGPISRLTAFTARGTYLAGDRTILDEVEL